MVVFIFFSHSLGFSGSIGMIAMVVVQVLYFPLEWMLTSASANFLQLTFHLQVPMQVLGVFLMDKSGRRPLLLVRMLLCERCELESNVSK